MAAGISTEFVVAAVGLILVSLSAASFIGYQIGSHSYLRSNKGQHKIIRQFHEAVERSNSLPATEAYKTGYMDGYSACYANVDQFLNVERVSP